MRSRRGRTGKTAPGKRCRSDRGAVLVEAALTLPFLIAIVMGIIDFGFVFNDWISVRQGARDGMRQAIVNTSPTPPSGGWSCPTSGGPSSGTTAYNVMCFTKTRVGLDQNNTRVKITFTAPFTAGQPVKVCVQYKTYSLTGAYSSVLTNKVLDTEVESLIEQTDATMTAVSENAITAWPASCSTL